MKSIEDTLKIIQDIIKNFQGDLAVALIGGYAAVLHGVDRFEARIIKGSLIPDDPFKHDVIFIEDKMCEFMRIDFLIARYKWELDAIRTAVSVEGIPVPIVTKPYLAALKLRAAGYKDAGDIVTLIRIMSKDEKEKTLELAKRIGRDKKLQEFLSQSREEPDEDLPEDLI